MLVTCHVWVALSMCYAVALALAVHDRGELIFHPSGHDITVLTDEMCEF